MDFLTNLGVGFGISVISLCALRTWRARSWGAISRVAHLKDKTLDGQVSMNFWTFKKIKYIFF